TLYAHDMARNGRILPQRMDSAIQAILCTDPDSAWSVFGDKNGAVDGIRYLRNHLAGQRPDESDTVVARYIGQVVKLSSKLLGDEQALGQIEGAVDRAKLTENDELPKLFNMAYRETVSPLKPQIMLQGEPEFLKNEHIQHR